MSFDDPNVMRLSLLLMPREVADPEIQSYGLAQIENEELAGRGCICIKYGCVGYNGETIDVRRALIIPADGRWFCKQCRSDWPCKTPKEVN